MKRTNVPGRRRRLLTIATAVAVVVTAAHRLLGAMTPAFWLLFHAALPAVVFSLGVWSAAGPRGFGGRTLLRGVVVVAVVTLAFGWINGHACPLAGTLALNFLVPLTVSTLGAAAGSREEAAGERFVESLERRSGRRTQ